MRRKRLIRPTKPNKSTNCAIRRPDKMRQHRIRHVPKTWRLSGLARHNLDNLPIVCCIEWLANAHRLAIDCSTSAPQSLHCRSLRYHPAPLTPLPRSRSTGRNLHRAAVRRTIQIMPLTSPIILLIAIEMVSYAHPPAMPSRRRPPLLRSLRPKRRQTR